MIDFSLYSLNTDNPSPLSVIYALTASFILACLISFTFEKTSKHLPAPGHFIQSMILGAIIATIVTIAIGDNIGRGLGMLGIMSIIRFRTNMTQPRNMVFIFSALGIGIACGVFSFNIAVYGCVFFCIIAFLLTLTPLVQFPKKQQSLRIQINDENVMIENLVFEIFKELKIRGSLTRIENRKTADLFEKEYTWDLEKVNDSDCTLLFKTLHQRIPQNSIRFSMRYEDPLV